MSPLYIVITDFNGYAQTQLCLRALYASHYRNFLIIVVDHGTTSETRDGLLRDFPNVVRVSASSDLWWTGATNEGVRVALAYGAKAVMLLNNDCYVTPDTLGLMVEQWRLHSNAILAPVQRELGSRKVLAIGLRHLLGLGFPTMPSTSEITPEMLRKKLLPAELIGGGRGVIISRQILEALSLFDDVAFPHYWADHDFYLRAGKSGVELFTVISAFVDIDNTRTTMADNPERLTFSQFVQTLRSIRSHRNLKDVASLFRRHYPVPHCYGLGVALYIGRYCLVYACKRVLFLAGNIFKRAA